MKEHLSGDLMVIPIVTVDTNIADVRAETVITETQSKIKSPKKRKKNSQVDLLSNLVDEFKLTNRLYAANKGINLGIINNRAMWNMSLF
jgi:hypothetical protein